MKIFILFSIIILISCIDSENIEKYKNEVLQTEQAFADMAGEQGIKKAFFAFAADSAVLSRNNKILKGQDDFTEYFSNPVWQNARLEWKPDFIDVAASGDLAYSYGSYSFSATDSAGKTTTSRGIFHTVWKRQKDGSWKFVWD
jgi:ketosteroid isomerase-like protein